ncbi:MAG: hypothetical protein R3B39_02310 [Candidatus Paceibacterota bacterium]
MMIFSGFKDGFQNQKQILVMKKDRIKIYGKESKRFTRRCKRDKIIASNIVTEMKDSYLSYAMSVITSRALPDIRDGLKPVHEEFCFSNA